MIDANIKEKFYERFNIPSNKVITDGRVLQIMAGICWSYTCTQNDFYPYAISTKDELIDAILEHALELSKNDVYIESKIEAIFGIGDEE